MRHVGGSGNETNVYVDVAAEFQTFDLHRSTGLQTDYTKVKGSTTLQKHTGMVTVVIPSTICRNKKIVSKWTQLVSKMHAT